MWLAFWNKIAVILSLITCCLIVAKTPWRVNLPAVFTFTSKISFKHDNYNSLTHPVQNLLWE